MIARFEHFPHDADIGIRGIGARKSDAFEQAALALCAIITDPATVVPATKVDIECAAPSDQLLLVDWLNRLIYETAVRRMLFARFSVVIEAGRLRAEVWGETLDRSRHMPAVEPKGATLTELKVEQHGDGWIAQCIIDV
jgi:SHS2 domain-containing protein